MEMLLWRGMLLMQGKMLGSVLAMDQLVLVVLTSHTFCHHGRMGGVVVIICSLRAQADILLATELV